MLRAVVSVPANIAEGSKRRHTKELIQFLYVGKGSLGEAEYYLRLAKDLGYISAAEFQDLKPKAEEVGKMLSGLIRSLMGGSKNG